MHSTIGLILPLFIVELVLLVIALIDCVRAKRTRGPKWLWVVVIVVFSILGPVAYFVFGRDNR